METTELTYPIPLACGFIATVRLPVDLTAEDAKKVSETVLALATTVPPTSLEE